MSSIPHGHWMTLEFSKYKGRTLPHALLHDPDWFFYMQQAKAFTGSVGQQAELLEQRARSILIPSASGMTQMVEHYIDRRTGMYEHFILVPEDKPAHVGHSSTLRDYVIDLSLPRRFGRYDKLGYKNFLHCLRQTYGLGDLTQRRCESFFATESNFVCG